MIKTEVRVHTGTDYRVSRASQKQCSLPENLANDARALQSSRLAKCISDQRHTQCALKNYSCVFQINQEFKGRAAFKSQATRENMRKDKEEWIG